MSTSSPPLLKAFVETFEVGDDTPVVDLLDLNSLPKGQKSKLWVKLSTNGLGQSISVPIIALVGNKPGPVVGVTAAIHGNELNGIKLIQTLQRTVDSANLQGTVVCVPVVNVEGYLRLTRQYSDGQDLNRLMPGKKDGNAGQVYAYKFFTKIITHFEYLIDLHTASFGRQNSFYVRADMSKPQTEKMALLQRPSIIVHNAVDGSLRAAAASLGIHAITVELGDPHRFQSHMIQHGLIGLLNVLAHLKMINPSEDPNSFEPIGCKRSYWIFSQSGGVLEVFPEVVERVKKGQLIARVLDIFGEVVEEYRSPHDAVVIGRSSNPVTQTGDRIVHLGVECSLEEITSITPFKQE